MLSIFLFGFMIFSGIMGGMHKMKLDQKQQNNVSIQMSY